jgi:hypothetical protein
VAQAAGIPITETQDGGVSEPKIVIVREPVTQKIIRIEKLVPKAAGEEISPWVWVGASAVVVVAIGGIVVLVRRAHA